MNGQPDAGSQVTMSGSLMQNIDQLGDNYWNGYSPSWTDNGQGRTWNTSARGEEGIRPELWDTESPKCINVSLTCKTG
jgi:hypothetical protein